MKHEYQDGERIYIVYDARAASGDTDNATIFESFGAPQATARQNNTLTVIGAISHTFCTAQPFKDGVAVQDEAPLAQHWC